MPRRPLDPSSDPLNNSTTLNPSRALDLIKLPSIPNRDTIGTIAEPRRPLKHPDRRHGWVAPALARNLEPARFYSSAGHRHWCWEYTSARTRRLLVEAKSNGNAALAHHNRSRPIAHLCASCVIVLVRRSLAN
ncbi:uncharacterized protein N7473_008022 [Penicillium subrubescens]|uniref:Uncharacterized protein n=1 Tax=Penicillium subrubescens TaxID=1316194 RepID=A0A1Q5TFN8_9EURO|nr:uncharacterized protein N7473_008022 [Penicillium subrubescens]KAJ5891794.1 hypothetical protein N7473_008022 [Penicillium subrubescens]OKO98985.1 hypothetical protein PENSUB_8902 [Penicillium subrubescens]